MVTQPSVIPLRFTMVVNALLMGVLAGVEVGWGLSLNRASCIEYGSWIIIGLTRLS